jgi:predicted DNA-binding transcriptional regulator AlpA
MDYRTLSNPPVPEEDDPHRLMNSAELRHLCGGISDMSLWRWLADEELGFPRPLTVGKRRYWRRGDVIAWISHRAAKAQADKARGDAA